MFSEEDKHRLIEHMHIAEARLLSTLTLIMQDGRRKIIIVITSLQNTIRKIDILAIHEEVLVQITHLIDGFLSQQTEGSTHHLYPSRFIPRKCAHIIMTETVTFRETGTQTYHLVESHHRRRQPSPTFQCRLTRSIQHANT